MTKRILLLALALALILCVGAAPAEGGGRIVGYGEIPTEAPEATPEPTPAGSLIDFGDVPPEEIQPTPAPAEPTIPPALTYAAPDAKSLPLDFSGGRPLNPRGLTDMSYSDSTITVEITKGRQGGTEYWVADIVIGHPSQLRTVSAGGFDSAATIEGTRLSARVSAVLAINGDYFSSAEKSGLGYIVRQGIVYRNNLEWEDSYRARLMDVLLIDEAGDFHIAYRPLQGTVPETIDGRRIINAFSFGPALVDNGVKITDYQRADRRFIDMGMDQSRQRVAICQAGPLHYKIVVCSGPSMGSTGMTLPEFANLVARQDVQVAYNMDGGDSSFLMLANQRVNGRSNRARDIFDIVYFASAE